MQIGIDSFVSTPERSAWTISSRSCATRSRGSPVMPVAGSVAETTKAAADLFYPGFAQMFGRIGRERGFPPPTRQSYDAQRGPTGALFLGDPDTIAEKMLAMSDALGGIDRVTIQMTNERLAHETLLESIGLLGTEVKQRVAARTARTP